MHLPSANNAIALSQTSVILASTKKWQSLWNANASLDGQEKISKVRLRPAWLAVKVIAFWSSLLQHSYHCSSNQKTNLPRKVSLSQGKYIGFYTHSFTQFVCGLWIFACFDLTCLLRWHVVSCDTRHQSLVSQLVWVFLWPFWTNSSTSPVWQRPPWRGTRQRPRSDKDQSHPCQGPRVKFPKVSQRPKSSMSGAPG
jgi:hypothetical protein